MTINHEHDQDEEDMAEEVSEPTPPVNTVMAAIESEMAALLKALEPVQDGEALFHGNWPRIADLYDDLTEALLQAGMEINRDKNPMYIELRAKLNSLLDEL